MKINLQEKNFSLLLIEIPDDVVGEPVYFQVYGPDGLYSSTKAVAENDTIVKLVTPGKEDNFDLIAYIPSNEDWLPYQALEEGYYCGLANVNSDICVTDSWTYSNEKSDVLLAGILPALETCFIGSYKEEYIMGDVIHLNCSASNNLEEAEVTEVSYYLNNSLLMTYTMAPYPFPVNTKDYSTGEYTAKIVVKNSEGLTAEDELEFKIEEIKETQYAPTISIAYPYNGQTLYIGANSGSKRTPIPI